MHVLLKTLGITKSLYLHDVAKSSFVFIIHNESLYLHDAAKPPSAGSVLFPLSCH